MSGGPQGFRLNELLVEAGLTPLNQAGEERFRRYLSLFVRWNERVSLSAVRDEQSILSRHFVESIFCARRLPAGISTLLDFGSGAGLPGIPISLCRPEILVTLAESNGKKAAFLRECVRQLELSAEVYDGRAETLTGHYGCVTLRAVDRMAGAVKAAAALVVPSGWLVLLTTGADLATLQAAAGTQFSWKNAFSLPGSRDRLLALGAKRISSPA